MSREYDLTDPWSEVDRLEAQVVELRERLEMATPVFDALERLLDRNDGCGSHNWLQFGAEKYAEKGCSWCRAIVAARAYRELLASQTAAEPSSEARPTRWHEEQRVAEVVERTRLLCWAYVSDTEVCIRDRSHDNGVHEPVAAERGQAKQDTDG